MSFSTQHVFKYLLWKDGLFCFVFCLFFLRLIPPWSEAEQSRDKSFNISAVCLPSFFFLFCAFSRTLGSNHTAPHEHSHMFHHSAQRLAFLNGGKKWIINNDLSGCSAVFSIWHRVYYWPPPWWVACDDISLITRLPAEGRAEGFDVPEGQLKNWSMTVQF